MNYHENTGYHDWMKQVDGAVWSATSLSVHDLPDFMSMDLYESGVSPENAAAIAIKDVASFFGF